MKEEMWGVGILKKERMAMKMQEDPKTGRLYNHCAGRF